MEEGKRRGAGGERGNEEENKEEEMKNKAEDGENNEYQPYLNIEHSTLLTLCLASLPTALTFFYRTRQKKPVSIALCSFLYMYPNKRKTRCDLELLVCKIGEWCCEYPCLMSE